MGKNNRRKDKFADYSGQGEREDKDGIFHEYRWQGTQVIPDPEPDALTKWPNVPLPVKEFDRLVRSRGGAFNKAACYAIERLEKHGYQNSASGIASVRDDCPTECGIARDCINALNDMVDLLRAEAPNMTAIALYCSFRAGISFGQLGAMRADRAARIGRSNERQSLEAEAVRLEKAEAVAAQGVDGFGVKLAAQHAAGGDAAVKDVRKRPFESAYHEANPPERRKRCRRPDCGKALSGRQTDWCSAKCRKWGSRYARKQGSEV